MALVDFILQIDCLSHFYDWGKLSVSTVTNHTWTTAALAKERLPKLPESAELCLLEQFTSPSSKPADLAVTKDTAHSSREGQGKKNEEKKGHGQNRLFWKQAEYLAWINSRIHWWFNMDLS